MIRRLFFWPFLLACLAAAQPAPVTLAPAIVVAGSPELIRVNAPATARLEGDWLRQKLLFFRSAKSRAWFALAGVDVEAPAGPSTLHISETIGRRLPRDLSQTIAIQPASYRTAELTVPPEFVAPPADALAEIEAEAALKEKIFSTSAARPLWTGDFRAPVAASPTDSFGTRRTFNGQLASIHKGLDFRARMGTPVRAGNSGQVVLARQLYYEGNCVVIDHGLGLYTISMHLSRIDVREGQRVIKGQRVGLSGATGRATGPHLHWAVRWQNAYLDPAKLLALKLNLAH